MKRILFAALAVFLFSNASSAETVAAQGGAQEPTATGSPTDLVLVCSDGHEMGTPFHICVFGSRAERLGVQFDLQRGFRKLASINSWMSDWIEGTELNKVNEAAGIRAVPVRKELFDLLVYAREVSRVTEGAFDPTFNAFRGLYSFKADRKREATEDEIRDRLPLVNYKNVELDPEKRTVLLKKSGMKLGLGGIGQGYGVDAVVADLRKRYSAGFVDGSGDTYFWGKKPNGELWITSIRDPRDKNKDLGRIYGTDFAITTAGDDEKFFMAAGNRRVHHILDPKTGRSATASRQVTVIAPTATEADAFDTAAFVMGPEKGRAVLENRGLEGVLVGAAGIVLTKGLKKEKTAWGEVYVLENQGALGAKR